MKIFTNLPLNTRTNLILNKNFFYYYLKSYVRYAFLTSVFLKRKTAYLQQISLNTQRGSVTTEQILPGQSLAHFMKICSSTTIPENARGRNGSCTEKRVVMPNDFNLIPNRNYIRIVPNSSYYLLRLQKCSYPKYNSANAKIVLPNAIVFVPNTVLQIQEQCFQMQLSSS